MPISMFSHSGRNASSVMPNCPAVCSAVTQRSVALRITGAASRAAAKSVGISCCIIAFAWRFSTVSRSDGFAAA